jgi:hypothetical protein
LVASSNLALGTKKNPQSADFYFWRKTYFFTVDLLQKSVEFKVVNRSNQIETQGKSHSAIAIPLTQDPKDLQFAKNMLNQNSFPTQCTISQFLLFRQRTIVGFLERCLAVFIKFCQALVASICQDPNMLGNVEFIVLEKLEVMLATIAKSSCYNFSGLSVGNQLCFLGVSFLFAAVMPFLAFFGRSMGCSLTSTSTTSKTVSLGDGTTKNL